MGYKLLEVELSKPLPQVTIDPTEQGVGLVARYLDRIVGFALLPMPDRHTLTSAELAEFADAQFAYRILEVRLADELRERSAGTNKTWPGLTIAVCTRNRAKRLSRLLTSIQQALEHSPFAGTELIVIDNAPSDNSTEGAVAQFSQVCYVTEPKPGLNFARNRALRTAKGQLLAFVDDDVVVDRYWLAALGDAVLKFPRAGGFTGLVLPYRLHTEAQICFERQGGFGRGFKRREWRSASSEFKWHPVSAGEVGAGCNMIFSVALLKSLGGFDEALDTGAPLPGGGDLDIFYRVLRSGHSIIYEPRCAVYHEHRETLRELRHQYWTWGLGMGAFWVKARRTDPELSRRQISMLRWWMSDQFLKLVRAMVRWRHREAAFHGYQLTGFLRGLFGEYDRSLRRVALIRRRLG